jgi:hypothetical protein
MVVVPGSGEFIAYADTQPKVNLHSDVSKIPFATRELYYCNYTTGLQLVCALAVLVHRVDPKISTIATCPITIEIVPYSHRFLPTRAFSSAANVLTVVRHPQYPSPSPCNIAHAPGDTAGRRPRRTWNDASNAVPSTLAVRVPTGSSFQRGFKRTENT